MDEEEQALEQKISTIEALLIGTTLTIVAVVNLIPFVGDFTSPIVGGLMFFYMYQKGLLGATELIANGVAFVVGLIPILQAFPAWLVAWPITVWVANHPQAVAVAGKVGELTGKGAAGGAAGGAAAKAKGAVKDAGGAAKEAGAAAGQGTEQKAATAETAGREKGPHEAGGEGEAEGMSEEEAAKRAKEEEVEKQMRLGAEVSPEEEAEEAAFNPEEARFREAKPKTPGEK